MPTLLRWVDLKIAHDRFIAFVPTTTQADRPASSSVSRRPLKRHYLAGCRAFVPTHIPVIVDPLPCRILRRPLSLSGSLGALVSINNYAFLSLLSCGLGAIEELRAPRLPPEKQTRPGFSSDRGRQHWYTYKRRNILIVGEVSIETVVITVTVPPDLIW